MFQYFPNNYVWNLSVNIATNGGHIGEIDEICRPLVEASQSGEDAGTEKFLDSWCEMADRLVGYADRDVAAGHSLTAGAKYARASVYYLTSERMQSRHHAPRHEVYRRGLEAFEKGIRFGEENCEHVAVPYEGTALPALFTRAEGVTGPAPVMVFCNGLDSIKEMDYRSGMATEFARRGVSTLIVDQPGTGESIRTLGLTGYHDAERWAGPVFDYLEGREDVDPNRIGIMGWSLGGYYAPRAAAFEKRFSLCASWGANYNWGELQKRRLAREGDRPVPHYWDHVQWVFGTGSLAEFLEFAPSMSLVGIVEKITVPYLITHGELDTQIPLEYAHAQFEAARNSPDAEFKLFTRDEGGAAHASADNTSIATTFIADWVSERI